MLHLLEFYTSLFVLCLPEYSRMNLNKVNIAITHRTIKIVKTIHFFYIKSLYFLFVLHFPIFSRKKYSVF